MSSKNIKVEIDGEIVNLYRKTESADAIKRLVSQNQSLLSICRLAFTIMIDGCENVEVQKQIGTELKNLTTFIERGEWS